MSDESLQSYETDDTEMPKPTIEANVSQSTSAETSVLVNELNDEEGLIFLGLSYDESGITE